MKNTSIKISGNNNRLIIHDNVVFMEGGNIKLEDEGNTIEIGKSTSIINAFIAVSDYGTNVILGDHCLISNKVVIRNSDVHTIVDNRGERINHGKSVKIGNHVWIAYDVTILKGTIIGSNCILGTKSLVTGTFPDNCVIAGNPAKILKTDVNWLGERLHPTSIN